MSRKTWGVEPKVDVIVPLARTEALVWTETGGELIVYDERVNHIHSLNPVAAAVWRHCDGGQTIPRIASNVAAELGAPVGADAIVAALARLAEVNLVTGPVPVARGSVHRRFTEPRNVVDRLG